MKTASLVAAVVDEPGNDLFDLEVPANLIVQFTIVGTHGVIPRWPPDS